MVDLKKRINFGEMEADRNKMWNRKVKFMHTPQKWMVDCALHIVCPSSCLKHYFNFVMRFKRA